MYGMFALHWTNNIINQNYSQPTFRWEQKKSMVDKVSFYKIFNKLEKNNSETIYLNYPLKFEIMTEEDGFYYSNKEFEIFAYGETQQKAEEDIYDEFKMAYQLYALESDDILDKNARILKKKILKIYGGSYAKEY